MAATLILPALAYGLKILVCCREAILVRGRAFGQTVGQAYQAPKNIRDANGKLISYTPAIAHGWVSVGGKLRVVNGLLNGVFKGWKNWVARKINDRGEVLAAANFNNGGRLSPNIADPIFLRST